MDNELYCYYNELLNHLFYKQWFERGIKIQESKHGW